jgi:hypothetical protein
MPDACTADIALCFSLNINMYVVYDNITTVAVSEPIPYPEPDIWQSNPMLLQGPEDDLGGRMMLSYGSTSTRPGDTMARYCESEDAGNEFVRILCSQSQQ